MFDRTVRKLPFKDREDLYLYIDSFSPLPKKHKGWKKTSHIKHVKENTQLRKLANKTVQ